MIPEKGRKNTGKKSGNFFRKKAESLKFYGLYYLPWLVQLRWQSGYREKKKAQDIFPPADSGDRALLSGRRGSLPLILPDIRTDFFTDSQISSQFHRFLFLLPPVMAAADGSLSLPRDQYAAAGSAREPVIRTDVCKIKKLDNQYFLCKKR